MFILGDKFFVCNILRKANFENVCALATGGLRAQSNFRTNVLAWAGPTPRIPAASQCVSNRIPSE